MPTYFSGLVSVRLENHGLLRIGPMDPRADEAEPFKNLRAGVPEPVVPAHGNHRMGGPHLSEKIDRTR